MLVGSTTLRNNFYPHYSCYSHYSDETHNIMYYVTYHFVPYILFKINLEVLYFQYTPIMLALCLILSGTYYAQA